MSTPGKGSKKERKKPIPVKTSLDSPYNLNWCPLERECLHFILNTLKEKFVALRLQKKEVKVFRQWGSKKKTSKQKPLVVREPTSEEKSNIQTSPETKSTQGWTDPALRKQLAIGINEVTKGLERNELGLVLVCSSVKPSHMTRHFIPLSKTRSVPACQVPRLSDNIAGLLGLKCVLALGFKRSSEAFADTVGAIAPKVPSLDVAWVPDSVKTQPVKHCQETEEKDAEQARGQKRKIEEVVPEASSVLLQPLTVKRTVPNPSKIRKPKKKKSKK
ncbi:ribonuclease P protein subunit p38 [Chanos chanos]|uniref:Ribonuclease P protein subunit p38 n=1 Tax=Chanos chanos TaxID=29144 RepID=A0A6J2W914_CHACN|nr:ribonuclease P protein subunit p38 [Chanos chanos]